MVYRRKGGGISRADRKLLYKAKRQRLRQQILSTVRPFVVGPRGSQASKEYFGLDLAGANANQRLARKAWGFQGKGAYSLGKFIRDAGMLGEGIKKTYNAWVPKSLRDQGIGILSNKLSSFGGGGLYTGRGEYEANELVAGGQPSMRVGGPGDETEAIVLSNREYIQDIYGAPSTAFWNQSLSVNPGLQQNFPWLSQIAANYDEYEFTKLLFIYKSTIDIGNANTTGQSGTLIMACDYNATHAPFASKDSMMQYHGAVSGKATDDMVCGIECDPNKGSRIASYVRTMPVPYGEDAKTYDLGLFQFALNNIPGAMWNIQLGELWVEYECILRKPKLGVGRGILQQRDYFVSGGQYGNSSPQPSLPLGDLNWLCKAQNSSIGGRISYPATSELLYTFPASYAGDVKLTYMCTGQNNQTAQAGSVVIDVAGNVEKISDLYASEQLLFTPTSQFQRFDSTSGSPDVFIIVLRVRVRAATGGVDNRVIMDFGNVILTGNTYWRIASLDVEEINPNFNTSADNDTIRFQLISTGQDVVTLPAQP